MNHVIQDKLPQLIRLCKKYRVKVMYLFGSATSTEFNDSSDIDLLIAFRDELNIEEYVNNYFELHYDLRKLFDRNVDLVTHNSLSNPYFIQGINQSKQLIYAA